MVDNLDFSEEEIQEQLAILGYKNIPKHRLREFKHDLDELIRHGTWKSLASPTQINSTKSQKATSQPSPPAYTKEKVSQCDFEDSGKGFFLHAGQADHDRQVLCQNRGYGRQQGHCDSYAQHSMAPKLQLPPGAPSRLQVEPDPDDTLHPPLPDSYTSKPDTQERCFIKRKVLRKHKGQSLVCDESVYSEDSALCLHRSHTSAGVQGATMYKMYNAQSDSESDDDRNSLSSSFWSDGECQKDEEEEVMEIEIERVEQDPKPVADAEDSAQEEKPELNSQSNMSGESSEGGSDGDDDDNEGQEEDDDDDNEGEEEDDDDDDNEEDDDDDDDEDEEEEDDDDKEICSSTCDSPAPSLMTSGYGTYRPEEQEGGDYRDDHTITEFDQDSQGDLSETRNDEEDDCSLCSFGGFDIEPTEPDCDETRPLSTLALDAEPEANEVCCGDDDLCEEVDMKPEEDEDHEGEETFEDLHAASKSEVANVTSEKQHVAVVEDTFILEEEHLEGGSVDVEGRKEYERLEEEVQDLKEQNNEESEDPDESSSNKDIKFIDSKVDFSQMTYNQMCEEWEGNLRQKKDASNSLEERLAELHLSTAAQHDFETENEDVTSQSDTQSSESEGISMSAFESYMRGRTRVRSDSDMRPKPKSFIRPVMSQQTIKKTDPVAKYFEYKKLWEMFQLPGERDRRALRLEIKERLAYQPPAPKPRRVYVPNTYIVPTEKKRSALRWEIRNDLANGVLPYKFSYRF